MEKLIPTLWTLLFSDSSELVVPVANDDAATMDEGGTINTVNVLANDTDADLPGDVLTATINITTDNGTLTLAAGGFFTYTHDGSETTSDFFDYAVSDGEAVRNGRLDITINPVSDSPPVANPDSAATLEGGSTSVLDGGATSVLANDTDEPDNSPLSVVNTGVNATDNGTVDILANGEFTYTHNGGETTADFFVYCVTDGTDVRAATVTIAIAPVNDVPVANDDAATMSEGIPVID